MNTRNKILFICCFILICGCGLLSAQSSVKGNWKYYCTIDSDGKPLSESNISPRSPSGFHIYENGYAEMDAFKVNGSRSQIGYKWRNENGSIKFYSMSNGDKVGYIKNGKVYIWGGIFYRNSVKMAYMVFN